MLKCVMQLLIVLTSVFAVSCTGREFTTSSSLDGPNPPDNGGGPQDPPGPVAPLVLSTLSVIDSETELDILAQPLPDAAHIDMKPSSGQIRVALQDCDDTRPVIVEAHTTANVISLGSLSCLLLKSGTGVLINPPLSMASSNKKWTIRLYQRADKADMVTSANTVFYLHSFKIEKIETKIVANSTYSYSYIDYKGHAKASYTVKITFAKSRLISSISASEVNALFVDPTDSTYSQIGENITIDETTDPDKISVRFRNLSPVYLSETLEFKITKTVQGDVFQRDLKYNIPVKQFKVAPTGALADDEYYRRIYNASHFSLSSSSYTTTGPFSGEDTKNEPSFLQQKASTSAPYYTPTYITQLLTLTDHQGFGVDYDLEIEF